jgi:acetoin:2,6-dichlorophenolindophenol oxidoreductase subunit alpha
MRSSKYNVNRDFINEFSEEENLSVFEKMCKIRAFEYNVGQVYSSDFLEMPVYLSVGSESLSSALSISYGHLEPEIFAQHRSHGYYIAFGGDLEKLIDEILHRPSGCARGMGGSASIHSPEIKMWGHDGFMGTQVPFGIGRIFSKNLNSRDKTYGLTLVGDASVEEGYVIGSLSWAPHIKNRLDIDMPMLFVCEDNDLSVLTRTEVRRDWRTKNLAQVFGMKSVEISDDPWTIMHYVKEFETELPAFMNVYVSRVLRHMGSQSDGKPEWNRFDITKKKLVESGLKNEVNEIEETSREYIDNLWRRKLEEY